MIFNFAHQQIVILGQRQPQLEFPWQPQLEFPSLTSTKIGFQGHMTEFSFVAILHRHKKVEGNNHN